MGWTLATKKNPARAARPRMGYYITRDRAHEQAIFQAVDIIASFAWSSGASSSLVSFMSPLHNIGSICLPWLKWLMEWNVLDKMLLTEMNDLRLGGKEKSYLFFMIISALGGICTWLSSSISESHNFFTHSLPRVLTLPVIYLWSTLWIDFVCVPPIFQPSSVSFHIL